MNERFLRALRRERVDRTPVWFMRQAGRSLPAYRAMRADAGMYEILRDPAAAAGVAMLPLRHYAVDACVLYNDLSTPYFGAGFKVEMRPGVGPVVEHPIECAADVQRLRPFEPRSALDYILDQIRILTERLDIPVLGFVGAPLTLSSYLIKGARKRNLEATKTFLWSEPEAWHRLADFWAEHMAEFGIAQHEAGAGAVQVFDSWAGSLAPVDYETFVRPHSHKLLARLAAAGVPTIHFVTGNPHLLPLVAGAGGDAVGVDWRIPLDEAWELVGPDRAIQGNLDPVALLAGREVAVGKTREILSRAGGRPGHIFNLGHGILPDTDPAVIGAVVQAVHDFPLDDEGRTR